MMMKLIDGRSIDIAMRRVAGWSKDIGMPAR